jgi:hypothetical protein
MATSLDPFRYRAQVKVNFATGSFARRWNPAERATITQEERDRFQAALLALQQKLYPGNKNDPIPGGVSYWFKQDFGRAVNHMSGRIAPSLTGVVCHRNA